MPQLPLHPRFPARVITGIPHIGILNLMPDKQATEERFRILLPETKLSFIRTESYQSRHTDPVYLARAYKGWRDVAPELDALVITGAPLGQTDYTDVAYWQELHDIVTEAIARRIPVLALCWGALAVAKIIHGIDKVALAQKAFGNFPLKVTPLPNAPAIGKGQIFLPVSRYAGFDEAQVEAHADLAVLAATEGLGSQILWDEKRQILLCAAHPEYAPDRLHYEYERDLAKGLAVSPPLNGHYADNFIAWHGSHFFAAWRAHVTGEAITVTARDPAGSAETSHTVPPHHIVPFQTGVCG